MTLLLAVPRPSLAADDSGLGGSFLTLPVGGRGAAVGAPYSSWPGDASSVYWNPAQLSNTVKPELALSRTMLFEDTSHSFIGFSWPRGRALAAGAGYIRQDSGGFERRTNPFDVPSSFDIVNEAFFASLSGRVPPARAWLRAGASFKAVRYDVGGVSAWGTGADAGLLAELPRGLRAAAVLRNAVRPSLRLVDGEVVFPSELDLSVSGDRKLGGGFSASLGAAAVKGERQSSRLSAGAELHYGRSASLRFGFSGDGFSSGVGLRSGNYSLDYAALLHELAPVHTVSLSVRFGITPEELEEYVTRGISRYNREEAARLAAAYVQQAGLQRRGGNLVRAIKTLETANLWDPSNAAIERDVAAWRAELDASLNRQAVERNIAMAARYLEREDLLAAREYLASALDLDPANAEAAAGLAEIDRKLGAREKLGLEEKKRREAAEKSAVLLAQASEHLKREEYRKAVMAAEKAKALNPAGGAAADSVKKIAAQALEISLKRRLEELGTLCLGGKYDQARRVKESVLRDDPSNPEAEKKAESCARAAAKPDAETGRKIEKLYYLAVDAYFKNDLAGAAGLVREILTIDPANEAARKLEKKMSWAGGGGK